jgi:hypothetical protein
VRLLRTSLVSVLAVVLALAVGIALGSGPLQHPAGSDSGGGPTVPEVRTGLTDADRGLAFDDAYAAATADRVVASVLKGRAVTVAALPGADATTVNRVVSLVQHAGGRVVSRVEVGRKLLDPAERQLVTELASQTAGTVAKGVSVPHGTTGYDEMGLLLAHALVTTTAAGTALDDAGRGVLAATATSGLLTTPSGAPQARGSLLVAVSGAPYGTEAERTGTGTVLASLLRVLDDHSDGVVLAGPVSAGAPDGLVGQVRGSSVTAGHVSTVDTVDRAAGAVVTVLAAAQQARGKAGSYGTATAGDRALPTLP